MSRYRREQQTRDFLVLVDTLAFFPPALVQQAYNAMKPLAPQDPDMARYLAYKEKVWIGRHAISMNGLLLNQRYLPPR